LRLSGGSEAVFYFAGHGVQLGAANYLLPVDIVADNEEQVKDDGLPLQRILDDINEQKARFSLAIIDACRDNPFARVAGRSIGTTRGLAPTTAATGQMVLYSAGTGQTALDRLNPADRNPNGVFTRVFLQEMQKPGVPVDRVLRTVRDQVVAMAKSVGHQQVPALYDQAIGEFYFRPPIRGEQTAPVAPAAAAQPAPVRLQSAAEIEQQLWDAIKDSREARDFEEYLAGYPAGRFAAVARAKLRSLQPAPPAQVATAAPSVQTLAPTAARTDLQRLAAGTVFRDCADCPEMVVIPPGRFTMGSPSGEAGRFDAEGPQHSVAIPGVFGVGKYEVTRGQFARFVSESGHSSAGGCYAWTGSQWEQDASKGWRNPGYPQTDDDPVVCVSWEDAKAYTQWLTRKAGKAYRMLTEAEWEYAARAGSQASRPWGDNPSDACRYANVADASARSGVPGTGGWTFHDCNDGRAYTAPVGSYQANAFGLHDMIGNAWEWTEDCWNSKYAGAPSEGNAWTSGECGLRVLRGGSWFDYPQGTRSAYRGRSSAGGRYGYNGFRLARTN
jgi:formylglycine-generating enzyme required for sulfatase activity